MIKTIVEKIIINYFGNFIKGLDKESLHLNLLSGHFKVNDISLNHHYFESLDIPLTIAASHIGELKIDAPITKLGSLTCSLNDVFVVLRFRDESEADSNFKDLNFKRKIIEKYAKSSLQHFLRKVSQKKDGMMRKLGKKLINNLEMRINNIHLRFEEDNEKAKYSFGITLKSVCFLPTDEQWNIQNTTGQEEDSVMDVLYKKLRIEELNVYWEEKPQFWAGKSEEEVETLMREAIDSPKNQLFHVSTDVRVKINNTLNLQKPSYEVFILLNSLDIEVSKEQVQQIMLFFQRLMLQTELKLIMKSNKIQIDQTHKELFQENIRKLLLNENHFSQEIDKVYEEVPASKLYEWVIEEVKEVVMEEKLEEAKKKKSGWFGWLKSKNTLEEIQDDLEKILLEETGEREGSSPYISLQLTAPEGNFRVSSLRNNSKSLIQLTYDNISCLLNVSTDGNSISFHMSLQSIQLDLIEMHKQLPETINILQTKRDRAELFELTYSKLSSQNITINTSIEVSQIVLTLKPSSYKRVKDIFSLAEFKEGLKSTVFSKIASLKNTFMESSKIEQKSHLSLNIVSPVVILPLRGGGSYVWNFGTFNLDSDSSKYTLSVSETLFEYHESNSIEKGEGTYLMNLMSVRVDLVNSGEYKSVSVKVPQIDLRIGFDDWSRLLELFESFAEKKSVKMKSLRQRRAVVEETKEFELRVFRRAQSGAWKPNHLILSGYFIYLYQQQNSLQQSLVIPVKGLTFFKEQEHFTLQGRHPCVFKDDPLFDQLSTMILDKNIELATQKELIQLFGNMASQETREARADYELILQKLSIQYHNTDSPIFCLKAEDLKLKRHDEAAKREASVEISSVMMQDLTFRYSTPSHQHYFIIKGEQHAISATLHSQVLREYTNTEIKVVFGLIDLNWKPQLFLQIHEIIKQYSKYETMLETKEDKNWKLSLKKVQSDSEFSTLNDDYEQSDKEVKQDRHMYLTVEDFQKHSEVCVYLRVSVAVSVRMTLFHRQTNIILSEILLSQLKVELTHSSIATFVQGSADDLVIHEVADYSYSKESIANIPPYCVLRKKPQPSPILQFTYSSYDKQALVNRERIISFLDLRLKEFQFHYFHQYTMRLLDYFLIQVVCVLTQPELLLVNKNLLQQLESLQDVKEVWINGSYDDVFRKFMCPFFLDIKISLVNPTLYLKAESNADTYFVAEIQSIRIHNTTRQENKRFEKSNLHSSLRKYLWEEDYHVHIDHFELKMMDQQLIRPLSFKLSYNQHLNLNLIKYLFSDIGEYDESSYIEGVIEDVSVAFDRGNYLHFMKFLNFNVTFEDLKNHLYDHNYKITKSFKPEPIYVKISIHNLHFDANFQSETLFSSSAKQLVLTYHRSPLLNKTVTLNASYLELFSSHQTLFRYNSDTDKFKLHYEIENTNKRKLNVQMDTARIVVDVPTLSVLAEWVKVEPWVEAVPDSFVPSMSVDATIKQVYFALKSNSQHTIFVKGSVKYSSLRNEGISHSNSIHSSDNTISTSQLILNIQLFRCTFDDFLKENIQVITRRSILHKTQITLSSQETLKQQRVSKVSQPSRDSLILIPQLNLDFSITDIQLFTKIFQSQVLSEETKQLILNIRQQGKEEQTEKEIFDSVVLSIDQSVIHLINNFGDCFVPLLTAHISQLHTKFSHNKRIVSSSLSLSPTLKFYNPGNLSWEPFLQKGQFSVDSIFNLVDNRKIIKFYSNDNMIVTLSRDLLKEVMMVRKVLEKMYEEERENVEYVESVWVRNRTGVEIEVNGKRVEVGEDVKMLIGERKEGQGDVLKVKYGDLKPLTGANILHLTYPKRYILSNGTNKFPIILRPEIDNLQKYIYIQGNYTIFQNNISTYLPIYQTLENITYDNKILDLSQLTQSKLIGHKVFSSQKSKEGTRIVVSDPLTVTNLLPIPVKVNETSLQTRQSLGTNKLSVDLDKSVYKTIGQSHIYLTSDHYLLTYTPLKILENGAPIICYPVIENDKFVHNVYLLSNNNPKREIQLRNKTQFDTSIGKTSLSIQQDGVLYEFTKSTSIESTSTGLIQKVTTITPKYILLNSTTSPLTILERQQFELNPKERVVFGFSSSNKNKEVKVVVGEYTSQPLLLDMYRKDFVMRAESGSHIILSCDFIIEDEIVFINFTPQTSYSIRNLTNYDMKVYQECLQPDSDCSFMANADAQPFGFDYPRPNKNVCVEVASKDKSLVRKLVIDLDDSLFEEEILLGEEVVYMQMNYNDGEREILLLNQKGCEITTPPSLEIQLDIASIGFSFIGVDRVRKQLLFLNFQSIDIKYNYSLNQLLLTASIQQFSIQNTRDPLSLFRHIADSNQLPFLQVRFEKDMSSPKVINYLGLSVNQFSVSLSTTDVNVLRANFEDVKEAWPSIASHHENAVEQEIKVSDRYYIDKIEIHPIKGVVSYKSTGTDNPLMKTFGNINEAYVKVNGVYLTNLSCRSIEELQQKIIKTYTDNIYSTVLPLIGNISILGNPVSLISKIGTGFKEFIELPVEGFIISPLEGGKGLTKGTKSLFKNTLEGTMNSVGGISETLGSGLASLTLDKNYNKEREKIINKRTSGFIQGVKSGGKSLMKGIQSGVKGVIEQPIKGASTTGFAGFLLGSFKGLTGLALKPLSGLLDMTTKTAEGIKNSASETVPIESRHPSRVFYSPHREYRQYSHSHSQLNEDITVSNNELKDLRWLSCHKVNPRETLVVTYEYIIVHDDVRGTNRFTKSQEMSEISKSDKSVDIWDKDGKFSVKVEQSMMDRCVQDLERILHYFKEE